MKTELPETVYASAFDGWNFSLHPQGPRFDVTCGKCGYSFYHRVPRKPYPKVLCPSCRTINIISVAPA